MKLSALLISLILFCPPAALAGEHSAKVGTVAAGRGGTNPVSFPPVSPAEWEYTYISDSGIETNISVFPGILVGKRYEKAGFYLSGGGGLTFNGISAGPGVYTAFGYITGDGKPGWHFNYEYKQTLGYSFETQRALSPSALRIGIIWTK